MEQWYWWNDGAHDPAFNMAVDEILLARAPDTARPVIRMYRWDRPAASIGCSQLFPHELTGRYTVVRRPTGGGVVYHDCDLTYTAVVPAGHALLQLDRMASYRVFHEALLPLLERLGVEASLKPDETPGVDRATMRCFTAPSRYDVMTGDAKFAGAAQRRTRNGILHQGSLALSAAGGDWNKLASLLAPEFARAFAVEFVPWQPPADYIAAAEALAESKYESDDWNHAARH